MAIAWGIGSGFAAGNGGAAFGLGAALALGALTVCLARAIARRGLFGGDPAVATIVVVIAALLLLFIFFPVGKSLLAAVLDAKGNFAPALAAERLLTADIWSPRLPARRHPLRRRGQLGACWRRSSACCRRSSAWCWRWSCSAAGSATPAC